MRADSLSLEEARLKDVDDLQSYQSFHERHRVFPAAFENRNHHRVFDTSAGVGCAAALIQQHYSAELVCNEVCPQALGVLKKLQLNTVSFDLDNDTPFPFEDGSFDAVVSLATIEHIIQVDHFVRELHRILSDDGYLYLSTPNYAGLLYLPRFVLRGRSFHDPLSPGSRYEFYAHVRYFTYDTLVRYVSSFGFIPDTVYLALPEGSTHYREMHRRSKIRALVFRNVMKLTYTLFSPRWAAEPIVCFRKATPDCTGSPLGSLRLPRKVVL